MQTWNMYMMAAAMAVATMGMSVHAADTTTTPPGQTMTDTGTNMQHIGGQMADETTTKDVRETLAKIVNDGVENNKFSSLTSYLAKADRQRLGDVKNVNNDDLNNAINQFRQDFKNKYNQDFDISSTQLSDVMVYAGTDKKSATVSFSKPSLSSTAGESTNTLNNGAPVMNNGTGATADRSLNTTNGDQTVSNRSGDQSGSGVTSTSAGMRTGPASNGSNSNSTVHGNDVTATPGVAANTGETNTNGTNSTNNMMANANIGMSSLTLNLVNEGHVMNAWRISAPQLSAEQLKDNLVKHIQMLDDQKAAWPSDVNAAYRSVSYHVLSAFSDSAIASER